MLAPDLFIFWSSVNSKSSVGRRAVPILLYISIDHATGRWIGTTCPYVINFDNFRQSMTISDNLRQSTTHYDNIRHLSTNFDNFRQISTTCDKFRQFSTNFDKVRHVSTNFDNFRQISTTCDNFQQFSTNFDKFFRHLTYIHFWSGRHQTCSSIDRGTHRRSTAYHRSVGG